MQLPRSEKWEKWDKSGKSGIKVVATRTKSSSPEAPPRAELSLPCDPGHHATMEIQIGQAVELMAVENAGIDITGKRGVVTAIPGHGLVSVALDGGAVVSAWPENLKILRSSDPAPATHTKDSTGSEPAAKGE